jgi:GTP-binding protein
VHVLAPRERGDGEGTVSAQLISDYKVVRVELEKYGRGLVEKKEIVVVNKMELVEEETRESVASEFERAVGIKLCWISAGMGEVKELTQQLI